MNIYFISQRTESGIWVFDHEHMNTVAEPLCNGTELVLDEYFRINMKPETKFSYFLVDDKITSES